MHTAFQIYEEGHSLFPRLFADYLHRFADLKPFFEYDPQDPQAYHQRAQWLDEQFHGSREILSAELEQYNHQLGAAEPAVNNARALAQPEALAIVTGQQAGLLGGPLFTLYKAVNTIRLARAAAHQLDRPVIPVFWVASEDHDFDEVRRAFMRDHRGSVRELSLPPMPGARVSMGDRPVPRRVESMLREVQQSLGGNLRDQELLNKAGAAAQASDSWAEWFARLMSDWLSEHGLVVLDPMRRGLRDLLSGFLPSVLVRGDGVHRETAAAANRLQRRGYTPALEIDSTHSHLFFYKDNERLALFWEDGRLVDREGQVNMSAGEVTKLMREEPWRFSPNVILRPMVQDILLPTLAMVAGPGEVAYLSQMRHVYSLYGLQMPIIHPRASFTLVGPDTAQRLSAYSVGVGTIISGGAEGALQDRLQAADRIGIDEKLDELRNAISEAYDEKIQDLAQVSPELVRIGKGNLERVLVQVAYLKKKAWYHHRRRHRGLTSDFQAAQTALLPGGQLQERFYAVLPILAEYGRGLIRALLRSTPIPGHQLAILTDPAAAAAPSRQRAVP